MEKKRKRNVKNAPSADTNFKLSDLSAELNYIYEISGVLFSKAVSLGNCVLNLNTRINEMDKKINKIMKEEKKVVKDTKELLKMDKKNDKIIDKAKKKMKGKC